MEVILKEDVANLGHRGDVVKVADGYGRNFLLPRKLALQATLANKAVIEQMKEAAARRSATEKVQAQELVAKLEPLTLSFTRKSGENGQLFGSAAGFPERTAGTRGEHLVEVRRVEPCFEEGLVRHEPSEERERRLNPLDLVLTERARQPRDRLDAIGAPGRELRH